MRNDSINFQAKRNAISKSYRFVVGIIFDVDSIYMTSHAGISGVPGTVLEGVLFNPWIVSQRLIPDQARAEIGSGSFQIVDKASQFTNEVRERLQDSQGLRYKEVRFYAGFEGDSFSSMMLVGTQIITRASYLDGKYSIECADIQRAMRTDIFVTKTTTLSSTLTAGDSVINLTDATAFQRVYHGASYSDAPSQTVGYVKVKNTIYRYSGKTGNQLTGAVPVFGTVAETITIDPAVAADRREKVEEYIYLELPAIKLALALITGDLYSDGQTLPSHWHMGVDDGWVTESDFTGIGIDLWNPATDVSPNYGYPVRFEGLTKTDGKAFLEKEIYLLLSVFSPVYSDGSLGLKRMSRISDDASHVAVLDNTNSIDVSELIHDMKSLHNRFRVNWSWNGERFNRINEYFDAASRATHGDADLYERSFKGLHGSIHTDAAVFQHLDMTRDRYAGPPQTISVRLLDSMNHLEVSDVVRGQWQHVRDYAGNGVSIDRAFEIQNISCDFLTGVTVDLFGSTARAEVSSPTSPTTALPDGFYNSAGTALGSAPGITISAGVLTAATQTLSGNASLGATGAIYYYVGNLTIASGVTLNIAHNVQLRVRGFLTVNGTINGVARGIAGVADDGRALSYSYTLDNYTSNTLGPYQTIPGAPGYVGASRGRDGVYPSGSGAINFLATRPAAFTPSLRQTADVLSLSVNGTSLLGLPDDLRGTGGAPGGRIGASGTVPYPSNGRGGTGGTGGAGLAIICRGMALGANGLINLSGGDSGATTQATFNSTAMYPGAGGAGGPGTLYILLDGSALSVPDFGNKFTARTGTVPSNGTPLATLASNGISVGGNYIGPNPATAPVAGYGDPSIISSMDFSGAALRVQYIPAQETPETDQTSRPPPVSSLAATGIVGGIALVATAPPPEQWDTIEYYSAATNDRTGATLASRGRYTTFNHAFASVTTQYYWVRTRMNGVVSDWFPSSATGGVSATSLAASGGTPGDSVEVQFAQTASGTWHTTFTTGDLYMRTRVGSSGAWQGPWRVVGENGDPGSAGADGNITSFIFRRSATQPALPTGNSPSGWSDSPPSSDGNPLWVSRAQKTPAGVLVGSWSTPAILVVDGEDGADGLPGIQGPGLFDWTAQTNAETTSTSITRTAGTGAWNAGAHSVQSFSGGCFFTARGGQTNMPKVIGFNDDPATDSGFSGITRGLLQQNDGNLYIVTNGTLSASLGAFTTADTIGGVHDGEVIRLYKNGVQVGTDFAHVGRLFLDVSLFQLNASFLDVHFGPSGLRGPEGPEGQPAASMRLTASSQTFSFTSAGAIIAPASIAFTATRQNLASATVWTTTPSVTLTNASPANADARVLTAANFGGNNSVRVRAESGGQYDEITVIRLTQGATGPNGEPGLGAFLSNETHTLPADPDGVVTAATLATAVGFFRVYSGLLDVTDQATFSITGSSGCTAQLNTAVNTPVNGQPKGFYRITAITADLAYVDMQASYSGASVPKRFTIIKSRAGAPGDGQNLLPIHDWVIGTTGNQGPSNRWVANGALNESAIVLGGAGTAPAGPLGASEPLWECRPTTGGGLDGDGGWEVVVNINHRLTYRSIVWFRLNQISGDFYHGCGTSGQTLDLAPNGTNLNPYFAGVGAGAMPSFGIRANQWYLSVGVIHGSGYTGGYSGIAGIYDPETGRRILQGVEYRMATNATFQTHRCYHFYDSNPATRQWMPKPRFEEINGGEPSLDSLMGYNRSSPWQMEGYAYAGVRTFYKVGGDSSWTNGYIKSAVGYGDFHIQFRAGQTNLNFIVGATGSPGTTTGLTIPNGIYIEGAGTAYINENAVNVQNIGAYDTSTLFGISRNANTLTYYKDGVAVRTVTATYPVGYLFATLYNNGAKVTNVAFGPGSTFENIDTNDLAPEAATTVYNASNTDQTFGSGGATLYVIGNGGSSGITMPDSGILEITVTGICYSSTSSAQDISTTPTRAYVRTNIQSGLFYGPVTRVPGGVVPMTVQQVVPVNKGDVVSIAFEVTNNNGQTSSVVITGATARAALIKR